VNVAADDAREIAANGSLRRRVFEGLDVAHGIRET
jgi:hypothetical protein